FPYTTLFRSLAGDLAPSGKPPPGAGAPPEADAGSRVHPQEAVSGSPVHPAPGAHGGPPAGRGRAAGRGAGADRAGDVIRATGLTSRCARRDRYGASDSAPP